MPTINGPGMDAFDRAAREIVSEIGKIIQDAQKRGGENPVKKEKKEENGRYRKEH